VKLWNSSRWRLGVALGLVAGFLVTGTILMVRAAAPPDLPTKTDQITLMAIRGRSLPPARAASDAELKDDEPIIGVLVDGKARAYQVASLVGPRNHVVNDVLAARPVTVTYCDRLNCARVFSDDRAGPLDVGVGGYDRGLLLLINGRRYRQNSGEAIESSDRFPYHPLAFVRTTWKAWRVAHPDTDVVGG
jgi:hypothetical protein